MMHAPSACFEPSIERWNPLPVVTPSELFWPTGDLFIDAKRIAEIYGIGASIPLGWEMLKLAGVVPLNLSRLVIFLGENCERSYSQHENFQADCRSAIRYFNGFD